MVFINPGSSAINMIPSFLCFGSAAYFATVALVAAFVIPYAPKKVISESRMKRESAAALAMVMIFLVVPARMRGRKVLIVWMTPITLTLN